MWRLKPSEKANLEEQFGHLWGLSLLCLLLICKYMYIFAVYCIDTYTILATMLYRRCIRLYGVDIHILTCLFKLPRREYDLLQRSHLKGPPVSSREVEPWEDEPLLPKPEPEGLRRYWRSILLSAIYVRSLRRRTVHGHIKRERESGRNNNNSE